MRHLVKGRKLGRTASHRTATMKALSVALIKEHRIVTTVAKAKELRTYVEPLITKAKEDSPHNRRQAFSQLTDKKAVDLLFNEVAQKAKDRPGGYTRVLKLGSRSGDGADMAVIELVDYNDIKPEETTKKKRTRRAGRSTKSSGSSDKETQGKSDKSSAKEKDQETSTSSEGSETENTSEGAEEETKEEQ